MRASKKAVGSKVGKMIFRTGSEKRIERRLNEVSQKDLKQALKHKGLSGVKNEDIAEVMAGKHSAGWSPHKMRRVVEALQDVGVARKARSASQMVTQASRDAQSDRKESMQKLARERRKEANAEAGEAAKGAGATGVLDRMRGAMGRANKAGMTPPSPEGGKASGAPRQNPFDKRKLKLQPKLNISDEPEDENQDPYIGFQA